jgi:hypothetical protein
LDRRFVGPGKLIYNKPMGGSQPIDWEGLPPRPVWEGVSKGKKTAAGCPPCGRATPKRPFGVWPARRTYKGWAWWAGVKL